MLRLHFFLVFAVTVCGVVETGPTKAPTTTQRKCDFDSVQDIQLTQVGDKHYYHYHVTGMKSWEGAKSWCTDRKMKLADPKNRTYLDTLYKNRNQNSDYYWLRAKYFDNKGFMWDEKNNVSSTMWESKDSFIRPRIDVSTYPTHPDLKDTCAFMSAPTGSLWYASCDTLHYFVCKVRCRTPPLVEP